MISLNHLNYICKAKLLWKYLNRTTLYAQWRYFKYHSIWGNPHELWRNLKIIATFFKSNLHYQVGSKSLFSLSCDPWCQGKSLYDWAGNHCFSCMGLPLTSFLNTIISHGQWKLPVTSTNYSICSSLILNATITHEQDSIF